MATGGIVKRGESERARRLTKTVVDALSPAVKEYTAFDSDLPGFGVRVRPSGSKSYVAMYRIGGRNSPLRKVTIGKVGKLTAEKARQEAREILAKAELGFDVAEERAKVRTEQTVADLCEIYLAEGCDTKKASTLVSDRSRIERHIKPLLGRRLIGEVSMADVERFLRDVANGKTAVDVKTGKHGRAIVRGGKGTATRTTRLLGGIFTFAVRRGLRTDNPVVGVRKYDDGRGDRYLTTDELQRLGAALREAETNGIPWAVTLDSPGSKHLPKDAAARRTKIDTFAIAAIRLLILTGCRLREVLALKWEQVNFERGLILLPDSKTGWKPVLLGAPALQILSNLVRVTGCSHVIPGEKPGRPRSDLKRPWDTIRRRAGIPDVRLHDLRHTFASHGAASGIGLTVVGRLLGHVDVKTTNRYSHLADDPLRRAADMVGKTLAAAMGESSEGATVITLTAGGGRQKA
ncbi:MAG: tyrosine-type recombinase/integrase [Labrys sp. (in: a-proteobacteria)]